MDEYKLIEIATRFRALEDAIEQADTYLAAAQEIAQIAFDDVPAGCDFDHEEGDLEEVKDLRSIIESKAEQCREDINAMQEFIRLKMAART